MSCPVCLALTDANGHCYTKGCANARKTFRPVAGQQRPQGLRQKSKRKLKEERETKEIRQVRPGECCELCNGSDRVSTHEIPAGSHRHRAVYDRRAQLRVCWECHQDIQSQPYIDQIMLKLIAMTNGINECHGSRAVSLEDIAKKLQELGVRTKR